ncbi:MAG: hypothetical protein NTV31_04925 [Bacteroidia bacterium]|nr:hypothetical protein [Bacteroidia bacterium]
MELWLRNKNVVRLEYDLRLDVDSQKLWHEIIFDPQLVSSILWPKVPLFPINGKHFKRNHPHERNYQNDSIKNASYRAACQSIANQIEKDWSNARCLIYAPLRGALPVWKGVSNYIKQADMTVYFPVTSSFILYPEEFGIKGRKNKTASGRYNNIFELERIRPLIDTYDVLIYIDEIISGGMMQGHLKDIFELGIHNQIPVVAAGIADNFGSRSVKNRKKFELYVLKGMLKAFYWAGCSNLLTEDQKYLLGIHYVDYHLGPHVVPVLDEKSQYYPEKIEFERDVLIERG